MGASEVKAVYDQVADDYADRFPTTEPEQPVELAMVAHFASLLPSQSRAVLDAGCGAGRMLPVLAQLGCQPAGIDVSPGMLRRAQQDQPGFKTGLGNITDVPHPSKSFDGLFYWYSTIHTPDDEVPTVFAEARRVVRDDGYVLVAFQAGQGTQEVGGGYRRLGHDVEIFRHDRTVDHVVGELRAAGFAEVARLLRAPVGTERTHQAVVIARAVTSASD